MDRNEIHADVANRLRKNGHSVGKVHRVYSPGDLGSLSSDANTVLFEDTARRPKRAYIWFTRETKRLSSGVQETTERVHTRVLSGWEEAETADR